jgi:serine/threonine-protein kinase
MQGKHLGPYVLGARLGTGGMGTVYRADGPDGAVAIKVLHRHLLTTAGAFERFMREAELGRRVRHANVVRTRDVDAADIDGETVHYLVMDYVEGQTLRELLAELGQDSPRSTRSAPCIAISSPRTS